ncbi:DUF6191 domain-containing protein [Kitasatospora sp. NPDC048239]|uniref:DUF6191 domain-containing protein n=1 Tax=Kitasatospora sp. NPDC048239 TaxID=3364046 RepID=UPI0037201AA4
MLSMVSVAGSLLFPAALVAGFFLLAAARQLVLRAQRPAWVLQHLHRRNESGERGVGATATEELHALLYPSKRVQLEQRRIELVLRDDENDGAPPKTGIDLKAGTATILRSPTAGPSTPSRSNQPNRSSQD